MRVLITGATGYFGRHILPQLVQLNDVEVLTINRDVQKAQSLFIYSNCKHCSVEQMELEIRLFGPEVVFHLATLSTSRADESIIEPIVDSNITFGIRLLDVLSRIDTLKLFVNTGSFAEYRFGPKEIKDAYLYTATKSAFRHFVDFYADSIGFKYLTVVPYTVYGGDDWNKKIMDYILESIGSLEPIKMTKGEQVLDFIHIDDVVAFYVTIIKQFDQVLSVPQGDNYYLGTAVGTTIRELASLIEQLKGESCNILWGGIPYRPLDVMNAVAPTELNSKSICWSSSIALAQGVKRLLETK